MQDLILGRAGRVATIRLARPPHNFFDAALLRGIADALADNDVDDAVVVTVMTAEGRSFCAGADFKASKGDGNSAADVYAQAARILDRVKPLVAAVGGPAVGGGLGLALAADFRVVSPAARFHANFAAIGLHPGFALTVTLPALIGAQAAREMLMTARRVDGGEAVALRLADKLVEAAALDEAALAFAETIAANAPLALRTIRRALPLIDGTAARAAMAAELQAQSSLFSTADFQEGVTAGAERRPPVFVGR